MIDLHSHILPGIDDGAATLDISVQMLQMASRLGFHTIVATPHLHERIDPTYQERIDHVFTALRVFASKMNIDLMLGFEVSLTQDLDQRLTGGEPATLGGSNAVLVDVPFVGWPLHAEESFFRVQTAGFRPILAHPERYEEIQRNPERALELVERGVMLQVTTGSFAGIFGRAAQKTAEMLLQEKAVHVVASDAHSAGQRFMAVEPGLSQLRELVEASGLERLTTRNPRAILSNQQVDAVGLTSEKSPSFSLKRMFQRLGSSPS
jgi:protein-tyrosine phosphatase